MGRNLEALVGRAQEVKSEWKDAFVSVEHLLLALVDDTRFGQQLFKEEGLDKDRVRFCANFACPAPLAM